MLHSRTGRRRLLLPPAASSHAASARARRFARGKCQCKQISDSAHELYAILVGKGGRVYQPPLPPFPFPFMLLPPPAGRQFTAESTDFECWNELTPIHRPYASARCPGVPCHRGAGASAEGRLCVRGEGRNTRRDARAREKASEPASGLFL